MTPSDTMQALVLHAVGDARLEEIPVPTVTSGQVRVRVGSCGVCGSDIPRIFVKGTYHFPTVCGHEFAGTIESCAEDVTDFQVGDPVVVFPLLWCGKCEACEVGQYVQCHHYDYLGSRSDGAFSEYVVAPEENLIRIPDEVSLEEAAMTEPAAVSLHALKRGQCGVGQTIAIFGAGPIGLITTQWAKVMGVQQVILFDIVPEKLDLAQKLGTNFTFDSRNCDPLEVIADLTHGQGVDLSIEAAGVPSTFVQALSATKRGGRMVMLGNPSADVTLSANLISQLMRREVDIVGTWNSDFSACGNSDDWRTVLNSMAAKSLDLQPLITHQVALSDAFEALKMMRDQRQFFSKVLIHP